jgi:RNA polymerase sigma-70 factor (ECF subfamily)
MNQNEKPPDPDGITAEALALQVQKGSKASFTQLVNRFGPRLYHYFRQKIHSREDCEDLVQETLVKAYRNIHLYRGTYAFSTWLFTIGTRRMVDYFRTRDRQCFARIPMDLPARGDPYETAARRDEEHHFWVQARALPGLQYTVLWLRYSEEMPVKEIAKVLGISRVHVKVLLYRARARLAKLPMLQYSRGNPREDSALREVFSYEGGS